MNDAGISGYSSGEGLLLRRRILFTTSTAGRRVLLVAIGIIGVVVGTTTTCISGAGIRVVCGGIEGRIVATAVVGLHAYTTSLNC